jgi:hypothetical protein
MKESTDFDLQAACKRVSLERKVANRVLLSERLATRDDDELAGGGSRGTEKSSEDMAKAMDGDFFDQKAKDADRSPSPGAARTSTCQAR